jgi:hypothetical protein
MTPLWRLAPAQVAVVRCTEPFADRLSQVRIYGRGFSVA